MKRLIFFLTALILTVTVGAVSVNDVAGGFRGSLTIGDQAQGTKTVYLLPGTTNGTVTFVLPDFNFMGGSLGDIVLVNIPMSAAGRLTLSDAPIYIKAIETRAFVTVSSSTLSKTSATLSLAIRVPGLDNIQVQFIGTAVSDNYDVVNGGFEGSWSNNEAASWHSFPSATGSLNSFVTGNTNQFTQQSDVRPGSTGQHSARISSNTIIGQRANGNCTNGQINAGSMTASDGTKNYNFSEPDNTGFITPFVGHPDSIVFWAKYVPGGSVSDAANQARMSVAITTSARYQDPETGLNPANCKIAGAEKNYSATADKNWQRIATPFAYTSLSADPALMLITFTTNKNPGGGTDGTDMVYLDDVQMVYNYGLKQFTQDGRSISFRNGNATTDAAYSDSAYVFAARAQGKAAKSFIGFNAETYQVCLYILPDNYTQSKQYAVYTLQMTEPVPPVVYYEYAATTCSNQPYSDQNLVNLTTSGDYQRTLISATEIDSIVTLHLTVQEAYRAETGKIIMVGNAFVWQGKDYFHELPVGTYKDSVVFTNAAGCDSTLVLNLEIVDDPTRLPQYGEYHAKVCEGAAITFYGTEYAAPYEGEILLSVPNQYGGDSIVNLTVEALPTYRIEEELTIREGDNETWHTVDLSTLSAGKTQIEAAYNTVADCDSIHILNLTIEPNE